MSACPPRRLVGKLAFYVWTKHDVEERQRGQRADGRSSNQEYEEDEEGKAGAEVGRRKWYMGEPIAVAVDAASNAIGAEQ